MADGSHPSTLDLLVIAQDASDIIALLCETYREVRQDHLGVDLDEAEAAAVVLSQWTGQCCADPLRVAWRVSILFGEFDGDSGAEELEFARVLIDTILDLPRQQQTGIAAIVKLTDPVQFHGHATLYREVYTLEMALREIVSYIFMTEFPNNLIDGLAMCHVKPANPKKLPADDELIRYGENQFFYILFDKYAILNNQPDVKISDIHNALLGATTLDEVRDALDLRPVKQDLHAGFLSSLQTLMRPLEDVRNAIAHNRHVSDKLRENFHVAAEQLRNATENFWDREAERLGN